jgi:PAS domain S-box-containing protein/putative nucleotidyltransferase with HDIG domain
MGMPLRVLIVEDSEDDVLLTIRALKKGGYDPVYERVEDAGAMRKALEKESWDVILCDYRMPQFNGLAAIALLKETDIDIPLIIVSGAIGEETAVECMRSGAHDYVMKGNLSRLVPAIERELKEAESRSQLKQAEERYRNLFENANEAIFVAQDGKLVFLNPMTNMMIGYSSEELMANPFIEFIHPDDRDMVVDRHVRRMKGEEVPHLYSFRIIHRDGNIRWVELNAVLINWKGKTATLNFLSDITERKLAEETLRKSEEKYRWVVDNMADVITVIDMNLRFIYVSPSIMRMRGYTAEEATAQTFEQVMTPESLQIIAKVFEEEMTLEASGTADPGRSRILELEQYRKDGSIVLMENNLSFMRDEAQKPVGIISLSRDITDRRRAEEALRESEEKYRNILESMNDSYFETDLRGNMTFCNPMVPKSLGYSPEEMAGMNHRVYMDPENAEIVERNFRDVYRENIPSKVMSYEVIRKDRTKAHIETSLSLLKNKDGYSIGYRGISRDITDRKRAEEALRESEALFRSYLENAPDGVYMNDLAGNFLYGNRKCEEITGYQREELIGKNFLELNLLSENSLDKAVQLLQSNIEGRSTGPDEIDLISKEGRLIPVEINTNVVQRMGKRIVLSFVRDITKRKKAEEDLKETLGMLRKALGTTIQVMVAAVETRDPYTAGHQKRSADLARAIATEMGLPQEKIDGIRMAGTIHDIGKLSTPSELLSKPTRLTNIEFSLIKEHSRSGYEILKDVKSPWPLAEIVYQHHERMDGSGYPRNLKGEEIIMEARIMAVADVVEAMASHRPYRPGLGINVALEEIEKNKGIHYDDTVADACLRLFREKGFQLEKA